MGSRKQDLFTHMKLIMHRIGFTVNEIHGANDANYRRVTTEGAQALVRDLAKAETRKEALEAFNAHRWLI